LEVSDSSSQIELTFLDGKIVSARKLGENVVANICRRLSNSGYLLKETALEIANLNLSLDDLVNMLAEKFQITSDKVNQAKLAYELDLLCSVRQLRSPKVNFVPKVFSPDTPFSLCVFPGQFLLDLSDLAEEEDRLNSLLGRNAKNIFLKIKNGSKSSRLNETEMMFLETISDSKSVAELMLDNLLSAQQSIKALLSLYDQNQIEIIGALNQAIPQQQMAMPAGPQNVAPVIVESNVANEVVESKGNDSSQELVENSEVVAPLSKFSSINFYLLNDSVLKKIVACIIISYFALLALFLPEQLNELFTSLNSFSSL
jgi:hypothetical protein